jgi:type I restriction enzyme S subunit
MMSEWSITKLGDVLEITSSKRIFRADYVDFGVPFYRSKEIIEKAKGKEVTTKLFISGEMFNAIKEKHGSPLSGDILLTSVGTLGVSYMVSDSDNFYFKDGNLTWFRNYSSLVDKRFILCWLQSNEAKNSFDMITIGSTQKALTISALKQIELTIPPLPTQKTIAHILSTLDDKIELNRKMNQTLESMAQAVFKSWFVDFDPVHAKAGANSEDELDKAAKDLGISREVLDLFPSEFEESELGLIPTGWSVGVLGDLIQQTNERITASEVTQNLPYVPIDCIDSKSLLLSKEKSGKEAQSSLIRFYKGDVLFGAMRPYFHKVCISPFEGTTRTTVFVLNSREANDYSFAVFCLHQESTISYATRHSTGTTIPYAKWVGALEKMPIVISRKEIRERYQNIVGPLLKKLLSTYGEQETLQKTRDTLLPKLLSGKLDISNLNLGLTDD